MVDAAARSSYDLVQAIHAGIRSRFPEPEWILNREVLVEHQVARRAGGQVDAVAVRSWADAVIHAFEVKVARSDWLRELKAPEKADVCLPFADYFWLAVSVPQVAQLSEVPEHWGLLVLQRNGTLRAVRSAPVLRPTVPLQQRRFWASMIRRAHQGSDERKIEERIRDAASKARDEGRRAGEQSARSNLMYTEREVEEAKRLKEAFGWTASEMIRRAPELRAILERGTTERRLASMAGQLRDLADTIDKAAL